MSDLMPKQMELQGVIERSLTNFKKIGRQNLTPAKVRSRMASLKETWMMYLNGHAAVTKATSAEDKANSDYFVLDQFEATEELYQMSLDFMAERLEELQPPVSPTSLHDSSNVSAHPVASANLHLPSIKLTQFDGSICEWENFRDRFSALVIDNSTLSEFAKMHYLTTCVTGRARDYIADIAVTAENFRVAWRALVDRFESKRRLLHHHLSTLMNLPNISRESADELQSLRYKVNFCSYLVGVRRVSCLERQVVVLVYLNLRVSITAGCKLN